MSVGLLRAMHPSAEIYADKEDREYMATEHKTSRVRSGMPASAWDTASSLPALYLLNHNCTELATVSSSRITSYTILTMQ